MILQYALLGFLNGISMSVISWIVGMILNSLFMKTKYYKKASHLNFITSKKRNTIIGLNYFKWIVKNTFFKYLNQKLKVEHKKTDLTEIRKEMTFSEISHLIGFIFVTIIAIYNCFSEHIVFALTMMLANILLNLYPALLQQQNKRRIDVLLKKHVQPL
ncbi:glycosyl-4,4'-diaponeurosporenoate acyltransferase CrtO family protein [Aureibaculum marinum]|nr:hypothetical protein [Aureibaculum marinum]